MTFDYSAFTDKNQRLFVTGVEDSVDVPYLILRLLLRRASGGGSQMRELSNLLRILMRKQTWQSVSLINENSMNFVMRDYEVASFPETIAYPDMKHKGKVCYVSDRDEVEKNGYVARLESPYEALDTMKELWKDTEGQGILYCQSLSLVWVKDGRKIIQFRLPYTNRLDEDMMTYAEHVEYLD